jgi:exosortase C (VPDSG-CTERM-specific)
MREINPQPAETNMSAFKSVKEAAVAPVAPPKRGYLSRGTLGAICFGILLLAFAPTLVALAIHVAHSQLHSYILLIPPLSFYLIYIRRDQLPKVYSSSAGPGLIAAIAGIAALALAKLPGTPIQPLSQNDYLGVLTLSFLLFLVAGGFFFLGRKWMVAAAFPVLFLFFMIPMPDAMVDGLETASKLGSAETASLFFSLFGTPFLRAGTVFQLPNITLEVAQECSGIRSSWILLITSLVASNLFLRTTWRRLVLIAFVIPLGLLRNGFRVFVIGVICVKYGPQMIESAIHRRGGPFFFALSLIPLFFLLWWLRKGETKSEDLTSRLPASATASDPRKKQQKF